MINNKDSMSNVNHDPARRTFKYAAAFIVILAAGTAPLVAAVPRLAYAAPAAALLFLIIELAGLVAGSRKRDAVEEVTAVRISEEHNEQAERDAALLEEKDRRIAGLEARLGMVEKSVREFTTAVPMEETLAGIIAEMTESSTLELTEHVYSLAEQIKLLGNKIREHLISLTTGDSSLAVEIQTLRNEVTGTNHVIARFHEIRDQQQGDMETVSRAVQSVGGYIATIAELAEQTGILAINASIEAARAGNVGKGFAVIAGEVHKLADSSREVAAAIGKTLESARLSIKGSYELQNRRIEDAVGCLEKGQKDQLRRADILFPHVERIGEGIESTREISEMVQGELDKISASLQSQDSVRQIMEHMIDFLQDIRARIAVPGLGEDPRLAAELEDILANHFTTRAEWQAFGRTIDESLQKDQHKQEKGDITLF